MAISDIKNEELKEVNGGWIGIVAGVATIIYLAGAVVGQAECNEICNEPPSN